MKDRVEVDHAEADKLVVTRADFQYALEHDIKPAFGISEKELDFYVRNGKSLQSLIDCRTEETDNGPIFYSLFISPYSWQPKNNNVFPQ